MTPGLHFVFMHDLSSCIASRKGAVGLLTFLLVWLWAAIFF